MVLRESAMLVAAGVAVGAVAAFYATRLFGSMLYGLTPTDPVTYGCAAGILAIAAVIASLVPARRASRVDPLTALRTE
jgi:putative ABC transport system permease protein